MTPNHIEPPLVPVLDVAAGRLVRAVAGRRDEYQPWISPAAPHADPTEFARHATTHSIPASGGREPPAGAERGRLGRALPPRGETGGLRPPLAVLDGSPQLYGADLDALTATASPNWPLWERLAGDYALWCDAGLRDADAVRRMIEVVAPRGGRAVLPTETAPSGDALLDLAACADAAHVAVSFDWRGTQPLSAGGWLDTTGCLALAESLAQRGVRSFIILDVAVVGTGRGPTVGPRCREFRQRLPDCEILAGGGVRDLSDVAMLGEAGCDAVLAASLLHNGAQ